MSFKTLKDFDLKGKIILLRADLNVPTEGTTVTDTTRIDRLKPTIDFLVEKGARTLVLSHFGRPKGKVDPEFSLSFLPPELKKSWGQTVSFCDECIGSKAQSFAKGLKDGEVGLLENLRFHKGEEDNDAGFVKELAALGEIYINDAFSAAHRAHASTEGLAHVLPAGAGFLMEAELTALNAALENPKRPVAAVVGGAKISTKLELLGNLVTKVDYLILGGGMANTFMYAQGLSVGKSLCEKDMAEKAREIMDIAEDNKCTIVLPVDRILVREFGKDVPYEVASSENIADDQEAVDVGPGTVAQMEKLLSDCKTVLWNGPLGVFEVKPFDNGTNGVANVVAKLTQDGTVVSVAGGGDTVAALEKAGAADKFTYVSSAGGAFLEWLEGKTLPGVAALLKLKNAA